MYKMSRKWKNCVKVQNFLQQVKQGLYYICIIYHLFKHEKYPILTAELYHPVKSFDEKLHISETCHKHLHKNKPSCQTVCNKMALDPILNELKDLKKLEEVLR